MRLSIRIGRGEEVVDARKYGAFAIHAPDGTPLRYYKADACYTVTHIQTGRKVCVVKGKERAASLARKLNNLLPEGNFTDEDFETEQYKAFVQQAKPIVDQHRFK